MGLEQEIEDLFLGFIAVHPGKGNAGMVINGHKQHFPALTTDPGRTITMDAVSGPLNAQQLPGVELER